ncbi:MAG TPA: DUF559 domain-containing protein, partial [Pseudonocardia sp.]|nr:DUF559 domain-containing protein [Pseudonocardia sp.]
MRLPDKALQMLEAGHGSASRRDFIAVGFKPVEVDYWIQSRALEVTLRGEVRVPGSGESLQQQLAAMLGRAGAGARLGGGLLLALHGLKGFTLEQYGTNHIIVPPHRRVRGVDFDVVHTPVPDEDRDRIMDLPAVTVARGFVGAARKTRRARFEVAHDDAQFKGLIKPGELAECAGRLGKAYGAPATRRYLATGRLVNESPKERSLFEIFRRDDPRPQAQVWVCWHGKYHRMDFCYLDSRLDLEYDGKDHDRRREADADRDLVLAGLQIQTLRITNAMLDDPEGLRRQILT